MSDERETTGLPPGVTAVAALFMKGLKYTVWCGPCRKCGEEVLVMECEDGLGSPPCDVVGFKPGEDRPAASPHICFELPPGDERQAHP